MSPIPEAIGALFDAHNFVHLSTLRRDGAPRNWIVWVGLEGEQILVCTSERQAKATDMPRSTRRTLSRRQRQPLPHGRGAGARRRDTA
jgi:hypothetical protein